MVVKIANGIPPKTKNTTGAFQKKPPVVEIDALAKLILINL